MTGDFGAVKILSKKESRERERELERFVALFVGRRVNLALKDGSVIINVVLEPLNGKHTSWISCVSCRQDSVFASF